MNEKPKSMIVGKGKCLACGRVAVVKAMSNGRLSVKCHHDGGWCHDGMSRSDEADQTYARNVTEWVKPEYRRSYLGADDPPAKAIHKPATKKTPPRTPAPAASAPVKSDGGMWG